MNRGTLGFSSLITQPILIGSYVTITSTVVVPQGVRDGDTMIVGAGGRNVTGGTPAPAGWSRIMHNDASSAEWNSVYVRKAFSEPRSYEFTIPAGFNSYVLGVFRGSKYLQLWDLKWQFTPEEGAQLAGAQGGIYIAIGCDAASALHITGFQGLETVGLIQNANTGCLMAWRPTMEPDGSLYGSFPITGSTPAFDGYSSLTLGG